MRDACSCNLFLFADDAALLISHRDKDTLQIRLGEELTKISSWLCDNRLSLHLGKTESILFGSKPRLKKAQDLRVEVGSVQIATKPSVKYLGCVLDNNLGGEGMALQVLGKVNARTKFLARKADLLDRESLRLLANGLVQCHFDYASVAWAAGLSCSLKKKLQVSQNKLVRVVMGLGPQEHIGRRYFQELNWLPVKDRVTHLRLNMVHKVINNKAPVYLNSHFTSAGDSHSHRTRGSVANLHLPRYRTTMGQCSFAYRGALEWNTLPLAIKQITNPHSFKENVRKWLLDRLQE